MPKKVSFFSPSISRGMSGPFPALSTDELNFLTFMPLGFRVTFVLHLSPPLGDGGSVPRKVSDPGPPFKTFFFQPELFFFLPFPENSDPSPPPLWVPRNGSAYSVPAAFRRSYQIRCDGMALASPTSSFAPFLLPRVPSPSCHQGYFFCRRVGFSIHM